MVALGCLGGGGVETQIMVFVMVLRLLNVLSKSFAFVIDFVSLDKCLIWSCAVSF